MCHQKYDTLDNLFHKFGSPLSNMTNPKLEQQLYGKKYARLTLSSLRIKQRLETIIIMWIIITDG